MKVFIVEDTLLVQAVLRSTVVELGGEVVGESDNQDGAVEGIDASAPDVVVLDLRLARGNGVEVLRRVKSAHPEIQVMVLTNYSHDPYKARCLELGADGFYDKTADFPQFVNRLADLAGAERRAAAGGRRMQ